MIIEELKSHWIVDSRGNPTIEVFMRSGEFSSFGASPSGASTGKREAIELRDNEFFGKGVSRAIEKVKEIESKIIGKDFEPFSFDEFLIELDGTPNKSNLGGNTTTALSVAFYKLYSKVHGIPLWKLFSNLIKRDPSFPKCMFNVINGGKHAGNPLAIQEFMIVPSLPTIKERIEAALEIYHVLRKKIGSKYGAVFTSVGDEGGFSPPISSSHEALSLLESCIEELGYGGRVLLSLDCAADSFYKDGYYFVDEKKLSPEELVDFYLELVKSYKILSLEDPFFEEHGNWFSKLRKKLLGKSLVIGDDLTVTNKALIEKAANNSEIDGCIIKVNQVGTLKEALEALSFSFSSDLKTIVSHRSGEVEDNFISHLAYGVGSEFIKAGAPARGERTSKYNELLRLENVV